MVAAPNDVRKQAATTFAQRFNVAILDAAISSIEQKRPKHELLAGSFMGCHDHIGAFARSENQLGGRLRVLLKSVVCTNLSEDLSAEVELKISAFRGVDDPPSLGSPVVDL